MDDAELGRQLIQQHDAVVNERKWKGREFETQHRWKPSSAFFYHLQENACGEHILLLKRLNAYLGESILRALLPLGIAEERADKGAPIFRFSLLSKEEYRHLKPLHPNARKKPVLLCTFFVLYSTLWL